MLSLIFLIAFAFAGEVKLTVKLKEEFYVVLPFTLSTGYSWNLDPAYEVDRLFF
jgi:hypothetical protein